MTGNRIDIFVDSHEKAIQLDHGEMNNLIGINPYKNKVTNSEFIFLLASVIEADGN